MLYVSPWAPQIAKIKTNAEKLVSGGPRTHGIKVLFSNFLGRQTDPRICGIKLIVFNFWVFRSGQMTHGRKVIVFDFLWHKKRLLLVPQEQASLVPHELKNYHFYNLCLETYLKVAKFKN